MNIRRYLKIIILLLAIYPLLYFGARASHLLVRSPEAIDSTGSPSRYSNRIIPCRGMIPLQILGVTSGYLFYPAHRIETWYRNRPEYFFRNSYKKEVEQGRGANALPRVAHD